AGSGTIDISVSASVSGLQPETLYHFRLVASNAAGTSNGDDKTFATVVPPTVRTIPATEIKSSSASGVTFSSAKLNAVINPNGSITSYYFEYGTSSSFGLKTPAVQAGNNPGETQVYSLVTGLTPNAVYYFRVVAYNSGGTSYGETMSFSTVRPRSMPWIKLLLLDEEGTETAPGETGSNEVPD
ncbi:MAG: fibronectin type III domain-containing protein, partial [Desulfobacteraceae bacterium]